ncbi:MAG: molybdenum cofactor biosynthesis protein MoaE [Armatimonadota bacterium]
MVELGRDPIRVDALLDAVRVPGAGAVVLFLGTVRDHSRGRHVGHLEYEAYEALARKEMTRIATHAIERWGVRIAIVHRLGTLAIGEISVAIAVAAPHRRDAFEAGRFAIDTLKQTVPIWKKEVWASGSEWIGQEEPSPSA